MFVYVNQTNYVSKSGRKVIGKSLTQLAEYQPLQKQLANLTIAGLNTSARQAMEYYDSNVSDSIEIPLLPRHISPDIVDVHRASQFFAARKQEIEERVRKARQDAYDKEIAERQLAVARQSQVGTSRGSTPERGQGEAPAAL